jgi:hypothetical protein
MNLTEDTYHLINKFLANKLQGRALDKFKARMRDEPEFDTLVKQQKEIINVLEANREQELKSVIKNGLKTGAIPMFSGRARLALVTAAAVTLLAVVLFTIPNIISPSESELTHKENNHSIEDPLIEDLDFTDSSEETQLDTQTLAIADITIPEDGPVVDKIAKDETLDSISKLNIKSLDIDFETKDTTPSVELEESELMPAKVQETESSELEDAAVKEETEAILKDELLSRKSFAVLTISPDFNEQDDLDAEETVILSRSDKKKANPVINQTPYRNISVEYWNSVVNYKGYKYNGETIKLYSIAENSSLNFKELDNRLYMNLKGTFYFLEKGSDYKRLAEVTSPALLNILKE